MGHIGTGMATAATEDQISWEDDERGKKNCSVSALSANAVPRPEISKCTKHAPSNWTNCKDTTSGN
jgi:hypothetical protein